MHKILPAIIAAVLAASIPTASSAASLPPGGAMSNMDPAPGFVGTEVANTGALPFMTAEASGTVRELVYEEFTGTLDFYYQIMNGSASTASIGRLTADSFLGFTTGVSYVNSGNVPPTEADRSPAGDTVGFDFLARGVNAITPGSSSDWVEISTNATTFGLFGSISVIDGGPSTVLAYSPAVSAFAVPEPVSLGLLCVGIAGVSLLKHARRPRLD